MLDNLKRQHPPVKSAYRARLLFLLLISLSPSPPPSLSLSLSLPHSIPSCLSHTLDKVFSILCVFDVSLQSFSEVSACLITPLTSTSTDSVALLPREL